MSSTSHTEAPPFADVTTMTKNDLLDAFRACFDDSDRASVHAVRAPGRVNLIGDHTDYNDGFVLPATIDRAIYLALRPRDDEQVVLHSLNYDERVAYDFGAPPVDELPQWARYVAGVTEEVRREHDEVTGYEALVYGDVPLGAGLSSSAALEVVSAVGLSALFDLELDPVATAELCQLVEQKYVGVECGIMDQFASRLGQADHALFLDCRSLEYRDIPLPLDDACLVIADSRVSRELASSKYNERRGECGEAVRFFQQHDDQIEALRDVSVDVLEQRGAGLDETIRRRARHVITENARVQEAARLLRDGELDAFGELMNASHASLRDDYEVTCEELDLLVEIAQETAGVMGARMTGAGFGGCTVTLARPDALDALKERMTRLYAERFGKEPEIYVVEQNLEAGAL